MTLHIAAASSDAASRKPIASWARLAWLMGTVTIALAGCTGNGSGAAPAGTSSATASAAPLASAANPVPADGHAACLAAGAAIVNAHIPSGRTAVTETSATEIRGRAEDAYTALTGSTTTEPVQSRVAAVRFALARIARLPADDLTAWPRYRRSLTNAVVGLQSSCASAGGVPDILNPPGGGRTPEELKDLLRTPCAVDGETITPSRMETGAGLGIVDDGVVCTHGSWSALKAPLGRCFSDQADLPYATADQRPLFCVAGQVFLDGQPNPGPLLNGSYLVGDGTGMVPPGTYEVLDVEDCYWERLDRDGYIIANNFILDAPRAEFTLSPGDHALTLENCAGFTRIP